MQPFFFQVSLKKFLFINKTITFGDKGKNRKEEMVIMLGNTENDYEIKGNEIKERKMLK